MKGELRTVGCQDLSGRLRLLFLLMLTLVLLMLGILLLILRIVRIMPRFLMLIRLVLFTLLMFRIVHGRNLLRLIDTRTKRAITENLQATAV